MTFFICLSTVHPWNGGEKKLSRYSKRNSNESFSRLLSMITNTVIKLFARKKGNFLPKGFSFRPERRPFKPWLSPGVMLHFEIMGATAKTVHLISMREANICKFVPLKGAACVKRSPEFAFLRHPFYLRWILGRKVRPLIWKWAISWFILSYIWPGMETLVTRAFRFVYGGRCSVL